MNNYLILTDTRQKSEEHIIKEFDKQGILHIRAGLPSADYMAVRYDNEKGFYLDYLILIDTKKDLLEVCSNLCSLSEHQRVVREIERAKQNGCKRFIFLVGVPQTIKTKEDIKKWKSTRTKVAGATLYKIINTFEEHHGCEFILVSKDLMGEKIIELFNQ